MNLDSFYRYLLEELLIETIVKKDDGYYVVSEKTGRNLGGPYSYKKAKKRLQQIEFFKHQNK